MTNEAIRRLAAAVTMQAVRDFFRTKSEKSRKTILKDLRSHWMDMLTNGTSINVAEQLEKHPAEIAERLRRYSKVKGA